MKKDSGIPKLPPLFIVKFADRLRNFFLFQYRRLTDPKVAVFEVVHHFWLAAAVGVVTELGIADILKDGKKSVNEIAELTHTNKEALYRIMRMLSSHRIFKEVDNKYFKLTPLAGALMDNQVRYLVMSHLSKIHFQIFSELIYSVRTGKTVSEQVFNEPLFSYLAKDPDRNEMFNKAMTDATLLQLIAILPAFSFSRHRQIVDVGGGEGLMLAEILNRYPGCNGIVFDLPQSFIKSNHIVEKYNLGERLQFVSGNFFEEVPDNGDLYILKNVLHNWDDGACVTLLRNVSEKMKKDSRLLIIEAFVGGPNKPSFGKMSDILMMVALGGKERTMNEFEILINASGLKICKLHETVSPFKIIELSAL